MTSGLIFTIIDSDSLFLQVSSGSKADNHFDGNSFISAYCAAE